MSSKVDYLYGEAIEATVRRVADAFDVTTGLAEDRGWRRPRLGASGTHRSLSEARRLRRAAVLPEPRAERASPRRRERLRRSRLYVPGNRPKLMLSAGLYGADGIILDLEDAVPPADKDVARILVRNALVALDWGSSERMVRINQGPRGDRDLAASHPTMSTWCCCQRSRTRTR